MLQVGQKLWYVPNTSVSSGGTPHEVTVSKIGRKWATVGEGWREQRIDLETMQADGKGYSSPGCCYLSQESYEIEQSRQKAWGDLMQALRYKNLPSGVTAVDIQQAMQLLKISP